ncbi:MAG: phage tail protein [Armatimonadota bacterium]|nr:phage tail protein [Armatimonadota bacterium]
MPPARVDPYRNFNFLVEIDGIAQTGFREVILPEATADVIEYREGHEPSAVRKLKGRVRLGNLILRWGATGSRDLYDWWRRVQDGAADRRTISVILLDDDRTPVKRWNFRAAWPVRYEISALDAAGHEVLIETLEVAHEGMELA